MKTYNDIYLETRNALRASGIEGYTLEARLLVATAAPQPKVLNLQSRMTPFSSISR